jgi:ceramide glucosyltransferase
VDVPQSLRAVVEVLAWALLLAGMAYAAISVWVVATFQLPAADGDVVAESGMTVLKPLCGEEPGLQENLQSFLEQDYPGGLQLVFGASSRADPGLRLAQRLAERRSGLDVSLVTCTDVRGANLKARNLGRMALVARHDILVVSDSDARIGSGDLQRMAALFDAPQVGAVTCLYRALVPTDSGLTTRLAALHIDGWFLPSAMVAMTLAPLDTCYGPLTAIRRSVLERAGGFEALADLVADDHELGQSCIRQGLEVRLAPLIVETQVQERSLAELIEREVRWARTVRATQPVGHAASLVTHPLPVLAVAFLALGSNLGLAAVALLLAMRLVTVGVAKARFATPWPAREWLTAPVLLLLRETLSLWVWAASFFSRSIVWRGRRLEILPGGRLAERLKVAGQEPLGVLDD